MVDKDIAEADDISPIQQSSDVDHDSTTGGTDADAHHTRYTDGEASAAAPVQSVNSQVGDVTVSEGLSPTVATYDDLPLDITEPQIRLVSDEEDLVGTTQLDPVQWRSLSDYTIVAGRPGIGDLYHALLPSYLSANYTQDDDITAWQLNDGSATLSPTTNGSPPSYEDSLVTSDGAAESQGQSGSSNHGDNLQATDVGTLDASTGFTLAVILREDNMGSSEFGGILSDVISSPTWNVRYDGGNYNFQTNGSRRTSVNAPTDNNPHTVIVTNINSELRMYLDGGTVGDTDATDPSFSTTDISMYEFEPNGSYYNFGGEIGAALLYQSGKTDSEVGEIHNYLTSL